MSEEESYARYMVKGGTITFIVAVLSALLGLGLRMFLTRALTVGDYGLLFAVISFISILMIFPGLGINWGIKKYLPEFRVKEEFTELKSSIAISLLIKVSTAVPIAVILIVFSRDIALGFFGTASAIPVIWILSIWFVVMIIVQTGINVFQALRDIPSNRSVDLFRITILFSIVFIVSVVTDLSLIYAAIAYLLASLLTVVWILIRLNKHRAILSKGEILLTKPLMKKLFIFGLPLILVSVSGRIIGYIDTLTITWFRTAEEVGLYQVALPATRILWFLGMAFTVPLFPMISELWAKKSTEKIRDTLYFLTKFFFILLIPTTLVFLAFPDVIIKLLFGVNYLGASLTVQILSITMLFYVLFGIFGSTLAGIGKNFTYGMIYGVAAVINLVGDLLLVPLLGINGAAIAFLIAIFVAFIVSIYFTRKHIKFPVPFQPVAKTVTGGILALLLIICLKSILPFLMWPKLLTILISAGLFYSIWILRMGVFVRKDFTMVEKTVPIPKQIKSILRKLTAK